MRFKGQFRINTFLSPALGVLTELFVTNKQTSVVRLYCREKDGPICCYARHDQDERGGWAFKIFELGVPGRAH